MNALPELRSGISAVFAAAASCCLGTVTAVCAASLEWSNDGGVKSAPVTVPPSAGGMLELIPAARSGLVFTNQLLPERHWTNQILLNGSGVCAGDIDGDGLSDLFFAGLGGGGKLFKNLGGWRFEDVSSRLGSALSDLEQSGAALVDVEGDGDLDLVVNSVGGGTRWLINDGRGYFAWAGEMLNARRGGTSMAFADIDGDGDLDVYVANYRVVTIRDQPNTRFSLRNVDGRQQVASVDGVPASSPEVANRFSFRIGQQGGRGSFGYDENGEADVLYRNEGNGHWSAVSFTDGAFLDEEGRRLTAPPFDWGLSVAFRDLNGDGAPDLYVCNDFRSPDRVWINDGHGAFRALRPLALRQISLSSMGVDFADVNRDGWDDILVVDMLSREHVRRMAQRIDIKPEVLPPGALANRPQYPRNSLFLNRGDGSYAEAAQWAGLDATEWSWTPVFLDVDLDGYEDLLVANGFERDGMNLDVVREIEALKRERKMEPVEQLRLRRLFPRLDTANLAFRNRGDGTFANVSASWGFNLRGVSHGMCLADLDNDGDLDVAINNLNGPAALYRNNSAGGRIAVRLRGKPPNTRGIGARIRVLGGPAEQSQEMMAGGRYLSSDDAMRVFAAARGAMRIEVTWRSGLRSVVEQAKGNRIYEIDEAAAVVASAATNRIVATPWFAEVSGLLKHHHVEEPYDDFARQPTLSHRLSQAGPGVAWIDLNEDGWEDLVIGSGRGGTLGVFQNEAGKGFRLATNAPFAQPVSRDVTGIVGWRRGASAPAVVYGLSNYEDGATNEPSVMACSSRPGSAVRLVPGPSSCVGPLAMADVDGDGELDLFVGGRAVPGRFPMTASSELYRGRDGKFERDDAAASVLTEVGLVSGAVFSDLDGDGDPDLVLACEWGPLKVFRNERGRFAAWDVPVREANAEPSTLSVQRSALSQFTGLWNGVAAGDFDGDGRLDVVASNAGRNTRYESRLARPVRLFYGDLSGDGGVQAVEGYVEPGSNRLLPLQSFLMMGAAVPAMRERMGGAYANYARLTLPEIYGEAWAGLRELNVTTLDSMVFLNRGDHFEARALPMEAQLSPAFALCVSDLDGDGFEDVFLSQNFFAVHPEYSRMDAGRGLVLRGNGRGGFKAVPGQVSGLLVHGEQRGAAVCDFDADGRVDLVVSQNAAETKLYRNATARPGLRVRLKGPEGNLSGVGATLRLVAGGESGPARELHAGAGYWSQDGVVQVMAAPFAATQLVVRWPGGKQTTSDLPAGAREVTVDEAGRIVRQR